MALTLMSPRFADGDEIPVRYTCEGEDVPPPLAWSGQPEGTESFVLIVEDPDAPDPAKPQRTWVHWVVYNIPNEFESLPDAVTSDQLPGQTREGLNDWGRPGWGGPCPPIGRHRYFFRLYALDRFLPDIGDLRADEARSEMEGHVLEEAELVGTYQKREGRRKGR